VPSLARKCKQVFMPAFTTPDPCKTVMKDAAIEVAVYNVFDARPEKTKMLCKTIIMNLFQHLEMIFNTLIIFRKFRLVLQPTERVALCSIRLHSSKRPFSDAPPRLTEVRALLPLQLSQKLVQTSLYLRKNRIGQEENIHWDYLQDLPCKL
jgi:hypothetical protein